MTRRSPTPGKGCATAAGAGEDRRVCPYYLINWAEEAPVPVAGVAGRDREMAAVAAFLDALSSGPCGLVLEGAAGIGKGWRAFLHRETPDSSPPQRPYRLSYGLMIGRPGGKPWTAQVR